MVVFVLFLPKQGQKLKQKQNQHSGDESMMRMKRGKGGHRVPEDHGESSLKLG